VNELLAFLVSGVVAGGLYAVLASGLVLGYATSGVFNFAYGAMAYVVAVLYYELNTGLHWPEPAAAVVSIVCFGPLVGLALDRLMFSRLARAGATAQIVATIGLMIALPASAIFVVDRLRSVGRFDLPALFNVSSPPGLGPAEAHTFVPLRGVTITTNQLAVFGAAIFVAVLLWLFVRHTRLGLHMRATVDRRELADLRGVDPERTSMAAWIVAGGIAGLIGVLAAPIVTLSSDAFTSLLLVSAAAAIFARLRSIPIAFAAGLGLGVVQNLVAGYVEPHVGILGLPNAVPFIILFIGLFFLNRSRARAAGVVSEEAPLAASGPQAGWRALMPWVAVVAAFCVYFFAVASGVWVNLFAGGLALSLVLLSFVVVTGIGGMVSLAQATFVLGAATIAGWVLSEHEPFVVALVAGTLLAMAIGGVMAVPALRLGGLTLALATLSLAYVANDTVFQIQAVGNHQLGWTINRPDLGIDFASPKAYGALLLVLIGIVVLLIRNLQRSASGRAMLAVRSSQVAAQASGVSAVRVKLLVFMLAAGLAGFGGVLYGAYTGIVSPSDFPPELGLVWLAVVVTFGVRRPAYAVVAGVVYEVFPHVLSYVTTSQQVPQILFGLGGMVLARNPDGVAADVMRSVRSVLERARHRRHAVVALLPAAPRSAAARGHEAEAREASQVQLARSRTRQTEETALTVRALEAGYDTVRVLRGIDLDVRPGRILLLVGANGGGKTTLCHVVAGTLKPWSGRVLLGGVDVSRWPAHRRVRAGLLLAPESKGIFPSLTVEEHLRLLLPEGMHGPIYDWFPVLAERRRVEAGMLSGGEQQMLTLAPLIVRPPTVLIADEPSLGLSPIVVSELVRLIEELRRRGSAIVLVEERVRHVLPVADEVCLVDHGRVAWRGEASALDFEELSATYLGRSLAGS
jgi:ABC-type branched-subunit amino acid transport system ATPase component/branched-subunit amino acid ABC-type transport system permease component